MKFLNTRASVMLVWALMMKMLSQLLISFQMLSHSFLGVLAVIGEALHSISILLMWFFVIFHCHRKNSHVLSGKCQFTLSVNFCHDWAITFRNFKIFRIKIVTPSQNAFLWYFNFLNLKKWILNRMKTKQHFRLKIKCWESI